MKQKIIILSIALLTQAAYPAVFTHFIINHDLCTISRPNREPAELSDRDHYGNTPLHYSVLYGWKTTTQNYIAQTPVQLLSTIADMPNLVSATPLHYALLNNDPVFLYLLKPHARYDATRLLELAENILALREHNTTVEEVPLEPIMCAICKESITNMDTQYMSCCATIFHDTCYAGWVMACLKKKILITCPLCRKIQYEPLTDSEN